MDLEIVIHRQIEGDVHRFDEDVAAVGVAGKVGFAHAGDEMAGVAAFGVDGGVQQKQGVAAVDKGVGHTACGGLDFGGFVHQRVMGDLLHQAQIEHGLAYTQILGDSAGAFQLDGVALAVSEGDGFNVVAAVPADGLNQAGGRILAA